MKCKACGFEIADKAIVCYRCGTPTADPVARPPASRRRSRRAVWVAVVIVIVVAGALLALWLMRG
jgi:hypothetical protein